MSRSPANGILGAALLATVLLSPPAAWAETCRAREIMTSQCTWFALQDLRGDRRAAAQAEKEATSNLIGGCSPGQYQMVLLRGNGLADAVAADLHRRGTRDPASVRAACRAEAGKVSAH
jgi:hypothetical protein